jgi:phage shock protein PspC (stress-responsive transcriptional regulator)
MNDEERTEEQPEGDSPEGSGGSDAPEGTEPPEAPTTPQAAPTEASQRPKRLLRSRSDRMVAGVAGGLGRYFGVDPVIIRIAFGVSIFFGGLGLIAYLALAIFVPTGEGEDVDQAPYERSRWLGVAAGVAIVLLLIPAIGWGIFWGGDWGGGGPWGLFWLVIPVAIAIGAYAVVRDRRERGQQFTAGGVFAAILLVVAILFAFFALSAVAAFATATGNGLAIALAVTAIGGVLIVTGLLGGARWLIIPAAALATGVGVAAATDLEFAGGIGEETHRPANVASLPADGYELGIGRLEIDLRELDWDREEVVTLDVNLGIGQAVVGVPEEVCVETRLHTGAGDLDVTGEQSDGFDIDLNRHVGSTATPRLELTGEVDLGQFVVVNDDELDLEDASERGFHRDDVDESAMRAAADRACAS